MWIQCDRIELKVDAQTASALVISPTEPIEVGLDALAALRKDHGPGERDHELVAAVRRAQIEAVAAGSPIVSFVFRATTDAARWKFSSAMSGEERDEVAYLMYLGHTRINRVLASLGIFDLLYVEWEDAEIDAFAHATTRFARELRSGSLHPRPDTAEARLARLDLWIAENIGFFRALPMSVALDQVLPRRVKRTLARRDRLQHMAEDLPAGWDRL